MKKMSKGVDAHKVGLGLAITSVILYFACLLFVLLAPEGVVVVYSYAAGALFAVIYNKL
ncbi:hypothetical protein HYY72_05700 [Candidatus Woesearchaeota archaeon]|nr:hypothetical protein [Candidatus Woesearchaeota archaeon]